MFLLSSFNVASHKNHYLCFPYVVLAHLERCTRTDFSQKLLCIYLELFLNMKHHMKDLKSLRQNIFRAEDTRLLALNCCFPSHSGALYTSLRVATCCPVLKCEGGKHICRKHQVRRRYREGQHINYAGQTV